MDLITIPLGLIAVFIVYKIYAKRKEQASFQEIKFWFIALCIDLLLLWGINIYLGFIQKV